MERYLGGKNKVMFLLFILLLVSCDRIEYPRPPLPQSSDRIYASAIVYPDGYDWKKDPLYGSVPARLVLLRDSVELVSVDLADGGISGADSHRIFGGNLYSFHYMGDKTVIKRNGRTAFEYDGCEYISDAIIHEGDFFTIGEVSAKDGWVLRKNGAVLHQEYSSRIEGSMYEDEGQLCFSFSRFLPSTSEETESYWYTWTDGVIERIIPPPGGCEIYAARRHRGILHYIAKHDSNKYHSWYWGSNISSIVIMNKIVQNFNLMISEDDEICHAILRNPGSKDEWEEYFWGNASELYHHISGSKVCAVCDMSPHICYATVTPDTYADIEVQFSDSSHPLKPSYRITSPQALTSSEQTFFIGVNDADDNYAPVLVTGQKEIRYGFNGFFTRLCLP